jgi:hypothetical protein
MPLTKVSFSVIQVANNVTSTTVGNTTSIPSFTFDQNGVITSASNTAISGAGITANTIANSAFQTGSIENYSRATGLFSGMRNRIINGAMVIDQRNAGASVTVTDTSNVTYVLDRWFGYGTASSKFSIQQNAGSVTPPSGFSNYFGVTSLAATTVGSSDYYFVGQYIEGFNTADLNFGTANAKTVTLSFWVRSSLTGTFGGSLTNSAINRSYPFSYTISSANTWEQKSITIAGDTTGTWIGATNGNGIRVFFSIGMGSSNSGTAGAWAGFDIRSATGATSVVGTNGATWYITGVQLEVGSTATSFDYRPYGTELNLCQRYFQVFGGGPPDSTPARNEIIASGMQFVSTEFYYPLRFIQEMRVIPTFTLVGNLRYYRGGSSATVTTVIAEGTTIRATRLYLAGSGGAAGDATWVQMGGFENDRLTASAEL